jgi:hypothetical protein
MSDGIDRMDELLRNRLSQYSAEPPERVWEGIRSGMAAAKSRRRIVYYRWLSAAAVLLVAIITGISLWNQPQEISPLTSEKTDLPVESPAETPETSSAATASASQINETPAIQLAVQSESQSRVFEAKTAQSGTSPSVTPVRKPVSISSMKFMRITRLAGEAFSTQLDNMPARIIVTAGELSNADRLIIASNMGHPKEIPSEDETSWKVGVHLSPGYASHSTSHSDVYAKNMTYSEDKAHANLSGGISAQYRTPGRWRMETGMYYSRTGGSSGNSIGFNSARADYATTANSAEKYFNTGVSVRNGQMSMNSTAGVISFSHTPSNAELISVPETNAGLSAAMLTPGEFSQVFDFVEIPLIARYQLVDARIDVEIMGGLSTNLLVGNNVYMENNNISEKVGTTRDINAINFSGTAGMGLVYALGKNISLSVEPRINYYLNSINHSGDVDFKPWRIGVFTGLNYEF